MAPAVAAGLASTPGDDGLGVPGVGAALEPEVGAVPAGVAAGGPKDQAGATAGAQPARNAAAPTPPTMRPPLRRTSRRLIGVAGFTDGAVAAVACAAVASACDTCSPLS